MSFSQYFFLNFAVMVVNGRNAITETSETASGSNQTDYSNNECFVFCISANGLSFGSPTVGGIDTD